mgnify:CR=1 FL=1
MTAIDLSKIYGAEELRKSVYGLGRRPFHRWREHGALGPDMQYLGSGGWKIPYTEEHRAVYRLLQSISECVRLIGGACTGVAMEHVADIGQFVRDNISTFVAADGQPLSCAIYVAIGVSRIECFTYRPPFGSYLSVEVYW